MVQEAKIEGWVYGIPEANWLVSAHPGSSREDDRKRHCLSVCGGSRGATGVLRRSSIFGANAVGLLQFAAFVAMVFILTNYLQQVRGYSALSAGLVFLPAGIADLVTSAIFSAQLVNRFGLKPIIISGMALQTIAYLLLSPISITESYIGGLLGPMLLIGVGYGLAITAINIAALNGTKRGEEGLASGMINTSRQIGGPIGLAVLLTVANFETSVGTGRLAVHSASTMVLGFSYAFLVAALLTLIGIIFTALLKQQRHSQAGVLGTAVTVHQS